MIIRNACSSNLLVDCSGSLKVSFILVALFSSVSFSFSDDLRTSFQNIPTLKIQEVSWSKNIRESKRNICNCKTRLIGVCNLVPDAVNDFKAFSSILKLP